LLASRVIGSCDAERFLVRCVGLRECRGSEHERSNRVSSPQRRTWYGRRLGLRYLGDRGVAGWGGSVYRSDTGSGTLASIVPRDGQRATSRVPQPVRSSL